jgi:LmbE family N-acetylglucosaminyl deacetylase
MNALVIAPHPDDESLGCGGTLCKHAARGDRVVVAYVTSGELGLKHLAREKAWAIREDEARRAAKVLGVAAVEFLRLPDWSVEDHLARAARLLRPILDRENPARIYVPHALEWHPDHRATLRVLRAACRGSTVRPEALAYEVWTPLSEYDHVEDITAEMPKKLRALRAHRSQLNEFDYVRAVRGLNAFRGELAAQCRYAEVFQTVSLRVAR